PKRRSRVRSAAHSSGGFRRRACRSNCSDIVAGCRSGGGRGLRVASPRCSRCSLDDMAGPSYSRLRPPAHARPRRPCRAPAHKETIMQRFATYQDLKAALEALNPEDVLAAVELTPALAQDILAHDPV